MQIYPKAIAKSKLLPKKQHCFVLIPFAVEFDEVYAEIKLATSQIEFSCSRADDLFENRPIMTSVVTELLRSHFVIADLTGRNPNVFYEVGIAHALRDLPNVVLLSQDEKSIPFDLRHLPIIFYELTNLRRMTVMLKKRIIENKDLFEAQSRLRDRYYHKVASDTEFDELLGFFDTEDEAYWNLLFSLLDLPRDRTFESELASTSIFRLKNDLKTLLVHGRARLFAHVYLVFKDLLATFMHQPPIEDYVLSVLRGHAYPEFQLPEREMHSIVIDLAVTLYQQPRHRKRALEWLLNFLTRPKVGGIDLNRAKVESFLITNYDSEIQQGVILCLMHESVYLREAAADFIGELLIEEALPSMILALNRETNPYVIRSIFSALGKLGLVQGGQAIITWSKDNSSVLNEPAHEFLVRHAEIAVRKVDSKSDSQLAEDLLQVLAPGQ